MVFTRFSFQVFKSGHRRDIHVGSGSFATTVLGLGSVIVLRLVSVRFSFSPKEVRCACIGEQDGKMIVHTYMHACVRWGGSGPLVYV